jgi:hypothetical protein
MNTAPKDFDSTLDDDAVVIGSTDLFGWRSTPPDAPGWWVAWNRYSMTLLDIEEDSDGNLVAYIDGRNKRVETIAWAVCWIPVPITDGFKIHLPNAKAQTPPDFGTKNL